VFLKTELKFGDNHWSESDHEHLGAFRNRKGLIQYSVIMKS